MSATHATPPTRPRPPDAPLAPPPTAEPSPPPGEPPAGPDATPPPRRADAGAPDADPDLAGTIGLDGRARVRRIVTRALLIAAALAVAFLVVRWWRARTAPHVPTYVTQPATRGELVVTVTATGALEARNVVEVGSEVSGRIKRVLVDFNDRVTKGEVLAEIDTELFGAQAEQARAALAQARAQLLTATATQDEAATTRDRDLKLFAQGVVAAQERDAAVAAARRADAAVALARANIEQASAALRVAETNLSRSVIRSPIDGVVLERDVEAGQTVVAAFQTPVLFRIAEDLRQMKVSVDVDEADIGDVRVGQRATFTVAAYLGRDFPATVAAVHNAARTVDRVVSYEAELDVDNRDLLLKPGMTVTAQIVTQRVPDALSVPSQALRFTPQAHAGSGSAAEAPIAAPQAGAHRRLWVLRDGAPVAVDVDVGVSNETRTQITAGKLAAGDAVIVNER